MGSTSVQDRGLIMEDGCRGLGSSRKNRPNHLFQSILLMAMNGFPDCEKLVLCSLPIYLRCKRYNHLIQ